MTGTARWRPGGQAVRHRLQPARSVRMARDRRAATACHRPVVSRHGSLLLCGRRSHTLCATATAGPRRQHDHDDVHLPGCWSSGGHCTDIH